MSTVEATDKESRAVARARKKADRIRDKHANDLPRSMQPSALVKTITIVVLVFALIYFLFPIYWAIIDWLDPWPVLALGAELPDLLGCFRSGGYARGCDGGIRYRKVQLQG